MGILNYARLHQPNYKPYCYKSIFFLLKLNATLLSHKLLVLSDLYRYNILHLNDTAHGPSLQYSASWLRPAWSTVSRRTSKIKAHRFPLKRPQYMNYSTKLGTEVQCRIRMTDRVEHSPRNLPSMFC